MDIVTTTYPLAEYCFCRGDAPFRNASMLLEIALGADPTFRQSPHASAWPSPSSTCHCGSTGEYALEAPCSWANDTQPKLPWRRALPSTRLVETHLSVAHNQLQTRFQFFFANARTRLATNGSPSPLPLAPFFKRPSNIEALNCNQHSCEPLASAAVGLLRTTLKVSAFAPQSETTNCRPRKRASTPALKNSRSP